MFNYNNSALIDNDYYVFTLLATLAISHYMTPNKHEEESNTSIHVINCLVFWKHVIV